MANNPTLKGVGSPLNYIGTNSPQPPNLIAKTVSPTSGVKNVDIRNFSLGDLWLNSSTNVPYMLTNMNAQVPTWTALTSSAGGANNFITDSGTATQVGGNLNVNGGDLINTAATPPGGTVLQVNLNRGTNGQIIVAKTGGASAYAHLTSSGGTITITEGANTLNIDTAGGVLITIKDDDGAMATPSAGVITFHDGNNIEIAASGSGVTFNVAGTTNHAVQLGNATGSLNSLSLGTANQVLQSGGGAADPAWSTATYPSTTAQGDLLLSTTANAIVTLGKNTTATRYLANTGASNNAQWDQVNLSNGVTNVLPIANGGTNASSFTNTDGVVYFDGTLLNTTTVGTSGQVLTSNGAGVAPTFQTASATSAFNSIVIQTFTSTGTYTPTAGMKYCIVECVGGGGGGGGAGSTNASQVCAGAGGGGGGYARSVLTAAAIGVSQAVTIGAGGSGGSPGSDGTTGGNTSLGALVQANGGIAGSGDTGSFSLDRQGGAGGVGATGTVLNNGGYGGSTYGFFIASMSLALGGYGGGSHFGSGGKQTSVNQTSGQVSPATNGTGFGGGGSGPAISFSASGSAGGNGSAGICVVTEYIH